MSVDRTKIKIEKMVFEGTEQGYMFKAFYLEKPKGEALIEITKDNKMIREFLFPAYKVYNIAAHAKDIVNGLKENNDNGLYVAGSTGLGGNVYKAT